MSENKKFNRKRGFQEVKKEFEEELLDVTRVTRVTAGGRQLRFRASVVIGDKKGRVGFGVGKAGEVVVAIHKAVNDAKKNLIKVDVSAGTIPHDIHAKEKSAIVFLHPASEGTGIIAGGSTRRVIELAGFKQILAKQHGCRNKINNARATLKALTKMKFSNN